MPSPSDISGRMRDRLRVTEPDLDTSIGTPVRKILDVVAEGISEVSADGYLLQYQYDIETRSGADLDDFVKLFGFSRLPARRATGQVTFTRSEAATDNIVLPANTRLATATSPQVVFTTVTPAILGVGGTEISVPAQALLGGTSGNVASNSITVQLSSIQGFSSFTNQASFTGGTDSESDAALRERFRKTIFRSLAGTESMFIGTALEDTAVTKVNVIGASKTWREQLQIVSGAAVSTITGSNYIYPGTSFFGRDLEAGDIFTEGVHYSIDGAGAITVISAGLVPDGVYELEFQYSPFASRNDPENGITNRIDLWVKGERAVNAVESLVFDDDRLFQNSDPDAPYYRLDYVRQDGSRPVAGNIFIPFHFTPLIVAANGNEMIIDGVTFVGEIDFWMIHKDGPFGWSPQSPAGVEFKSVANGLPVAQPDDETPFTHEYTYNSVPTDVQRALQRWRLVTTDVWVHQAKPMRLNLHFAVILEPGFSAPSVKTEMFAAISDFIDRTGFSSTIQASDLLSVGHSVAGVDAIRFVTFSENASFYAIQEVDILGAVVGTYSSGGRATDVATKDDQVPVLNDITLTIKASNTFGTV